MIYTIISLETRRDFIYTLNYLECGNRWITDNSAMIEKSKEIIIFFNDFFVPFWSESHAVFGRDFNHIYHKRLNISEFILMFIEENKGIT